MPWCPKCKLEYFEGIEKCADCGVDLVEELTDEVYTEESDADFDNSYDLEEFEDAEDTSDAESDSLSDISELKAPAKIYVKREDKMKDLQSSAYTLLTVGILGMLFILLLFFDVISLRLDERMKYIAYGTMTILFLIFIIFGIRAFLDAKIAKKESSEENQLTDTIMTWLRSNIASAEIDEIMQLNENLPEEIKYFKRCAYIKDIITLTYGELEESYLEKITEDIYNELY